MQNMVCIEESHSLHYLRMIIYFIKVFKFRYEFSMHNCLMTTADIILSIMYIVLFIFYIGACIYVITQINKSHE